MIETIRTTKNEKENVFVVEFNNGVIKHFDTQMEIEMYLEEINEIGSEKMFEKEIESTYDLVEKFVDEAIEKYGAFMEIFDNENTSKGRIYVQNTDDDENKTIINIVSEVTNKIKGIKVTIDKDIDITLGYLHFDFEIKILLSEMEIEAIEDFEESLNNIEYASICKKQKEANNIMDNVIFDDFEEKYDGSIETIILFQDEIEAGMGGDWGYKEDGGDWYYRASGGAFSSATDYWNYILG